MKENVFKYVYRIENQYFIIIFFAQNGCFPAITPRLASSWQGSVS